MLFTNILFPVDFSSSCSQMAPLVASVALRNQAAVTLLHVLELPPGVYREARGGLSLGDITSLRSRAEDELQGSYSAIFNSINISLCVREGDPCDIIGQHTRENHIDVVCMPTRGRGPFRRLLLGSVTAKVLNDLDIPVLTAAHYEDPPSRTTGTVKSILCCVDLSGDSARVIEWGVRVARQFQADLMLLHALPAVEEPTENRGVRAVNKHYQERARQRFAQLRDEIGFDGELHLVGGPVARSIRQTAIELNSDLILIGRGVMREQLGRMRTNTYAIIRESPCPVLSV